jgi:hypothetical protein
MNAIEIDIINVLKKHGIYVLGGIEIESSIESATMNRDSIYLTKKVCIKFEQLLETYSKE